MLEGAPMVEMARRVRRQITPGLVGVAVGQGRMLGLAMPEMEEMEVLTGVRPVAVVVSPQATAPHYLVPVVMAAHQS